MGLAMNTIAALGLVLGGAHGIGLMFDRYATPEARSQCKLASAEKGSAPDGRIDTNQ